MKLLPFTLDAKVLGRSIDSWAKRRAGVAKDMHTLAVS